jgi:hypothetical protein
LSESTPFSDFGAWNRRARCTRSSLSHQGLRKKDCHARCARICLGLLIGRSPGLKPPADMVLWRNISVGWGRSDVFSLSVHASQSSQDVDRAALMLFHSQKTTAIAGRRSATAIITLHLPSSTLTPFARRRSTSIRSPIMPNEDVVRLKKSKGGGFRLRRIKPQVQPTRWWPERSVICSARSDACCKVRNTPGHSAKVRCGLSIGRHLIDMLN